MPTEVSQTTPKPSYFLISVSTRENLDLCTRYGLAGFPSGESGAWTFCEIHEGDYVSFLYGARAHNLYRVVKRESLSDAEHLPPWKPLVFKESGKTYSFPSGYSFAQSECLWSQLLGQNFSTWRRTFFCGEGIGRPIAKRTRPLSKVCQRWENSQTVLPRRSLCQSIEPLIYVLPKLLDYSRFPKPFDFAKQFCSQQSDAT